LEQFFSGGQGSTGRIPVSLWSLLLEFKQTGNHYLCLWGTKIAAMRLVTVSSLRQYSQ
jgi:hypothetical protein